MPPTTQLLEPQSRPPITDTQRNMVFKGLIRIGRLCEQAIPLIKLDCFGEHELWLSLIWALVSDHWLTFNELPSKATLITKIEASLEEDPLAIMEGDEDVMNTFLRDAFDDLEEHEIHQPTVAIWLRQFLEDRLVNEMRETMSLPQTPSDLLNAISKYSDRASVLSDIDQGELDQPFAEGWDLAADLGPPRRTNIDFIDAGIFGTRPGESNGIMGPQGGGKTTLGVMISVEAAQAAWEDWITAGRPENGVIERSYHFTYEESPSSVRVRAISYLAKIPKERVLLAISTRNYGMFTRTGGALQPYELEMYRRHLENGQVVRGEWERFNDAKDLLNKHWRLIDMCGSDKNHPDRGYGLVDELASIIRNDINGREQQFSCCSVLVDYVLVAVNRYMDAHGKKNEDLRFCIDRWPDQMRHKIGVPMNCATWSLQQLDTITNSLAPGKEINQTASAEGKAFGRHCDFLFALGNANKENQLIWWACKHRHTAPLEPVVLTLRGAECRLQTEPDFQLDSHSRTIIRVNEANRLHAGTTQPEEDSVPAPAPRIAAPAARVAARAAAAVAAAPVRRVRRGPIPNAAQRETASVVRQTAAVANSPGSTTAGY